MLFPRQKFSLYFYAQARNQPSDDAVNADSRADGRGRRTAFSQHLEQPAPYITCPVAAKVRIVAELPTLLRRRVHDRLLPQHHGHLTDKNFVTRLLYKDIY